jgi:ribonuclease P protein component
MEREHRLTGEADFKRVRRTGKSQAHPLLVVVASRSPLPRSRFGVVAGKAVGGAVQRNRAKRRLRAAVRMIRQEIRPGFDVILIARPAVLDADWQEVRDAVRRLFERAGLVHAESMDE